MSVAFRRESDEEHKEPKFEIPLPPGPNLVTERGLEHIQAQVLRLEALIAAQGDEPAREEAKRDLRYWQARQATAQIAPLPDGGHVAFGTRVRIRMNGTDRTICIVGHDEADPARGFLSVSAPLARALIGAGVGDQLAFAGTDEAIEILEIGPIETS